MDESWLVRGDKCLITSPAMVVEVSRLTSYNLVMVAAQGTLNEERVHLALGNTLQKAKNL